MRRILKYSVNEIMTASPITVSVDTLLGVVMEEFERTDYSAYPVLEQYRLMGIVTQYDLLKAFDFESDIPNYEEVLRQPVANFFRTDIQLINMNAPVVDAIRLMSASPGHSILVTDDRGELTGIIARSDLSRCLRAAGQ